MPWDAQSGKYSRFMTGQAIADPHPSNFFNDSFIIAAPPNFSMQDGLMSSMITQSVNVMRSYTNLDTSQVVNAIAERSGVLQGTTPIYVPPVISDGHTIPPVSQNGTSTMTPQQVQDVGIQTVGFIVLLLAVFFLLYQMDRRK